MSWFSKNVRHALSRLFGGASYAEKRNQASLLEQEAEAKRDADARMEVLSRLRRAVRAGRRSLLSWFDDGEDTIGS